MHSHDALYAHIGRCVRRERERAGFTQEELAARVALSRTSVTNIERGRQKVLAHTLWHLAAALQVSPAELLPESLDDLTGSEEADLTGRATA